MVDFDFLPRIAIDMVLEADGTESILFDACLLKILQEIFRTFYHGFHNFLHLKV